MNKNLTEPADGIIQSLQQDLAGFSALGLGHQLLCKDPEFLGSHRRLSDPVAADEDHHRLGKGSMTILQEVVKRYTGCLHGDGIQIQILEILGVELALDLFAEIFRRLLRVSRLGTVQDKDWFGMGVAAAFFRHDVLFLIEFFVCIFVDNR